MKIFFDSLYDGFDCFLTGIVLIFDGLFTTALGPTLLVLSVLFYATAYFF